MHILGNDARLRIVRAFLWITGIFLLFWWPLSHWFYPEFYHRLLGFRDGSYPDGMVKVIGTCGIFPVLLAFFSAINLRKNRYSIITLIIFSLLMSATYVYLIITHGFPENEIINVVICVFSALFLIILYPWKSPVEGDASRPKAASKRLARHFLRDFTRSYSHDK